MVTGTVCVRASSVGSPPAVAIERWYSRAPMAKSASLRMRLGLLNPYGMAGLRPCSRDVTIGWGLATTDLSSLLEARGAGKGLRFLPQVGPTVCAGAHVTIRSTTGQRKPRRVDTRRFSFSENTFLSRSAKRNDMLSLPRRSLSSASSGSDGAGVLPPCPRHRTS